MSITIEEKEELFKEFEARLQLECKIKKKQGYASGYETIHNLERAHGYFRSKYYQMVERNPFEVWGRHGVPYADWDKIRIMVCHAFGVNIVKHLPEDKIEAANDLAISVIDLIFAQNEKTLMKDES